jgi:LysM repeat protein
MIQLSKNHRISLLIYAFFGLLSFANTCSAQRYTVRAGDTPFSIAQKLGMNVDDLNRMNGLSGNSIHPGQVLKVKNGSTSASSSSSTRLVSSSSGMHTVRAGETLFSIAQKYGMNVDDLKQSNGIGENGLHIGQRLKVHGSGARQMAAASSAITRHTVSAGENLFGIAKKYGLTVEQLLARNPGVYGKPLALGTVLALPPRALSRTRVHQVQAHETISSIARQHGVSTEAVRNVNPNLTQNLQPSQRIVIPGVEQGLSLKGTMRQAYASGKVQIGNGSQGLSISHSSLPIGTVVLLSNPASNRHTFAKVTARKAQDDFTLMISPSVADILGARPSVSTIEIRLLRPRR